MENITSIPAPRVPFIDGRTQLISREWYRFLLNLFTLTGGGRVDTTLQDILVGPQPQLGTMAALQQDNVPFLVMDTIPAAVPIEAPGTLFWDNADGNQTLSLVMANGTTVQQIGEEQYFRIKADAPIINGQVVMFTGSVGSSGALKGAPATGLAAGTALYTMGVATEDIALNDWGYVTSFGLVRKIDTTGGAEAWVDGQIVYLDPAVPGGLTKIVPEAPNPKVVVAAVVHAATNGALFIRPSFGGKLGDFEGDVDIDGPGARQVLQRDSTNTKWENTTDLALGGFLTLPKAAGSGIKVDELAPAYGWRDLTAPVDVRGVGANDPTFAVYTGTTMRAYQFSATTMQEAFFVFHVPHDWVPGTDIYFHAHWSNAATAPNTGNVVWKFDYTFAKGFGQEAFPAVQTVEVIAPCPAVRYTHNVSETTAVTISTMEVDGLIMVRGYRDAANALDTCTDAVFLHTMDIHYQSTNMATKNKAPNFNA